MFYDTNYLEEPYYTYFTITLYDNIITLFIASPVINTEPSTFYGVTSSLLTLSCISSGSPPDLFIWRKDGGPIMQSDSISNLAYSRDAVSYRAIYIINTFSTSHVGRYRCVVSNPLGSDSHSIIVEIVTGRF